MTLAQRRSTWSILRGRWWPEVHGFGCRPARLAGFLPVVFVSLVISMAYYTAVPTCLVPMLRRNFPLAVSLLIFFHLVFLNVVVNYALLVYADPGGIPPDWAADPPPFPVVVPNVVSFQHARQNSMTGAQTSASQAHVPAQRPAEDSAALMRQDPETDGQLSDGRVAQGKPLFLRRQDHLSVSAADFPYAHLLEERAIDGGLRYCYICNHYKSDRSHHCSMCGRCIRRMDHHCVFINNCVGFLNHKFFICFITYAFIGCVFVCILGFPEFLAAIGDGSKHLSDTKRRPAVNSPNIMTSKRGHASSTPERSPAHSAVFLIGYILTSAFAFALSMFVVFHAYLLLRGKTTIEMYDIVDPGRAARVGQYDLGPRENFRLTCGSTPLCWLLPTRYGIEGDGLSFQRNCRGTSNTDHDIV